MELAAVSGIHDSARRVKKERIGVGPACPERQMSVVATIARPREMTDGTLMAIG